ncbi:hypothetical protein ABK040_009067 [Willaertia magna]
MGKKNKDPKKRAELLKFQYKDPEEKAKEQERKDFNTRIKKFRKANRVQTIQAQAWEYIKELFQKNNLLISSSSDVSSSSENKKALSEKENNEEQEQEEKSNKQLQGYRIELRSDEAFEDDKWNKPVFGLKYLPTIQPMNERYSNSSSNSLKFHDYLVAFEQVREINKEKQKEEEEEIITEAENLLLKISSEEELEHFKRDNAFLYGQSI